MLTHARLRAAHPNVVRFNGAWKRKQELYISMELYVWVCGQQHDDGGAIVVASSPLHAPTTAQTERRFVAIFVMEHIVLVVVVLRT